MVNQVGKYKVEKELGQGGNCYSALDDVSLQKEYRRANCKRRSWDRTAPGL